ncbi:MAG: response regulator [Nitrospiraceae bacterium]|nr:response regulator [Nitrospiraceae bacterium]
MKRSFADGLNKVEILIVEDSQTQAVGLKYVLENNGYSVSVAINGKKAFAHMRKHKPDLVISDIVMPEMDGFELCKKMKDEEGLKRVPVILLTALSDAGDVLKGLECRADNFITKPYDPTYLIERINRALFAARAGKREKIETGAEIIFGDQKYLITSGREHILDLLLSSYETAVMKNRELMSAQQELKHTNIVLQAEITERKRAEEALRKEKEKIELLAESARMLLSTESPEKIIQVLAGKVMRYLNCHVFFNYLIENGTQRMHLNAWHGIPDAVARQIEHLDFEVAVCGCVARDERRTIAGDIPGNPDGKTGLVSSFGVKAYACHPLVYNGKTIGTLSFGTRDRTRFTEEELDLMETVTDTVAAAMARKLSELALKDSLNEKEILLKELYHRTKNNMHVISSMLTLQMNTTKNSEVRQLFKEAQGRINSMALVHQMLYETKELSKLDLKDYLEQLARFAVKDYKAKDIRLDMEMDSVPVSLYVATPCGLIVNELVSNSLKHAFHTQENGEIRISLKATGNDVELACSDNGAGFPAGFQIGQASSLGLRLVDALAKQLMGSLKILDGKKTGLHGKGAGMVIHFDLSLLEK